MHIHTFIMSAVQFFQAEKEAGAVKQSEFQVNTI